MKIHKIASLLVLFFISLLILAPSAGALEMRSGNIVTIDSPVDDDVFASGNTVDIRAPVNGAVIAAGSVIIDAPVKGDIFVAGGSVVINSDVGGKIVAAGGNIELRGSANNVVAAGGNINIGSNAVVTKDAFVAGGTVNNQGKINGKLKVTAQNFQNSGSVGNVDYQKPQTPQGVGQGIGRAIGIFSILWFIGSLVLGIVLVMLFSPLFLKTRDEMSASALTKTAVGFVLVIASMAFIVIVAVTIIGIPIALMAIMALVIALALSNFLVAFALGGWIMGAFKMNPGNIANFVIGFIVLSIILAIPLIGGLAQIIVSSLGFGAIYYVLKDNWQMKGAGRQKA